MRSRIVFTGRLRFAEINTHDLPASMRSSNRRSSSGVQFVPAVLHSHQNTLISSPSLSSPFERDFSKVDIQSHGARADGVFGSVQLHSDLTSLHVGERQRAQPFVVLRRPRTNFFPAAVIAALFLRLQHQLYKA